MPYTAYPHPSSVATSPAKPISPSDFRLHFISGLPRSGSTLLVSILRQNPALWAGIASPVGGIFSALQRSMSRHNESAVFISPAQRKALLAVLFSTFYQDQADQGVTVFDTNRLWCSKLSVLAQLFPSSKVICCVRPIAWIMDSIERLIQRNPLDLSGIFNFDAGGTVYSRVSRLASSDGMVGGSLDALRDAFFGELADRLILVDYDTLARKPGQTMKELYEFLGLSAFKHDFDNVAYEAPEFDLPLGTPGLHTVKPKVEWAERSTILPPDLFSRFDKDSFWLTEPSRGAKLILARDTEPWRTHPFTVRYAT